MKLINFRICLPSHSKYSVKNHNDVLLFNYYTKNKIPNVSNTGPTQNVVNNVNEIIFRATLWCVFIFNNII